MPGHFSTWLLDSCKTSVGKMKVQHNYLSQIAKNFQPGMPQVWKRRRELGLFYLANDHNQSFIIQNQRPQTV